MIARFLPRWVSTRVLLAMGLSTLSVTLVLMASMLGLVPDTESANRRHRADLAETVALAASLALDEEQPALLQATLDFGRQRHPLVSSIGMRRADGGLLASSGDHARTWQAPVAPRGGTPMSTDTQVLVPVMRGEQRWGTVELALAPLKPSGWRGWLKLSKPALRTCASRPDALGSFMKQESCKVGVREGAQLIRKPD